MFIRAYESKHLRVAECLLKDHAKLMSFYDVPVQLWQSLPTCNPIQSAFGTIHHGTKRSKVPSHA